eukprot:scaffold34560_cov18-Tisochrysis_lutea.AAC.4
MGQEGKRSGQAKACSPCALQRMYAAWRHQQTDSSTTPAAHDEAPQCSGSGSLAVWTLCSWLSAPCSLMPPMKLMSASSCAAREPGH